MITKKYTVKNLHDYKELTEEDIESLEYQYKDWLRKCPVKLVMDEEINTESNDPYPHYVQSAMMLVPMENSVKEKEIKKYEVQYKIDVWGSIEITAEDDIEAEEIALNEFSDEMYDNIYLHDFDIEVENATEIKEKKVA